MPRSRGSDRQEGGLRVLRVYHSGVVAEWRRRNDALQALGDQVMLVSATQWDEGGKPVKLEDDTGSVIAAGTWGSRPNVFVYDPRPLWRALRSSEWDVIDAHEEPCSLAVAEVRLIRALAARRAALVLYSAQNIAKRYPPPFRWLEALALRSATGVHVCSTEAGAVLRDKGYRGEMLVVPLGVDVERFSPSPGSSRDDGTLAIGYVGRLEPHKGVDVLIRAVAGDPRLRLDVVGDGPERDRLHALASQVVGERATFSGFADHAELPARYRSFDVVVVPSVPTRRWREQFCRVAVEAMASGVPVVASDSGALPEVIGPGGILVSPGDPNALREALVRLIDPGERRILGERGREWAQRYRWEAVAARQDALYRAARAEFERRKVRSQVRYRRTSE